ncbi:MAG: hypothetical protein IPH93_10835 [Saprospiraceae bacterium]|nr:hypothetical protein [Saprospiraceae bacterium]
MHSCRVAKDDECRTLEVKIIQIGSDQLTTEIKNGLGPYSHKWTHGFGDFPTITVSESGTYTVTVTDHGNACTNSASYPFALSSGGCGSFNAVTDAENNLYDIVTIGTQCWMKSNVVIEAGIPQIKDRLHGRQVPLLPGAITTMILTMHRNMENCTIGMLSSQVNYVLMVWHIPSMAEWEKMITYLGKDSLAAIAMKKVDPLWIGKINANNASGFSALPAGRMQPGGFIYEGRDANFWATDESNFPGSAKGITLTAGFDGISKIDWGKSVGFSCRCVKN